jgi:RHS repeat-associated protein
VEYTPDNNKIDNYYPVGVLMPNRHESSNEYRYGFNGQEKDDEVSGEGNSYDFGARLYNPRVGRWMSCDPLEEKYPNYSPYCFVGNMTTIAIDPNGKEIIIVSETGIEIVYKPKMKITSDMDIFTQDVIMGLNFIHNNVDEGALKIGLVVDEVKQTKIGKGIDTRADLGSRNDVSFNNKRASLVDNGGWQAPIISLAHELDHVARMSYIYMKSVQSDEALAVLEADPNATAANVAEAKKAVKYWGETAYDEFWSEKEEERASTDPNSLEIKTAEEIGGGTRSGYTDPLGVRYVDCVTCTTPSENLTDTEKKELKLIEKAIEKNTDEK